MAQLSVASETNRGFPGMIADSGLNKDVRSYASGEASVEIPFGVMVAQGDTDDKCISAEGKGIADFVGVVVHSNAYARPQEHGEVGLKPKTTIGAMVKGTIWVPVEDAIAIGDPVYVRVTAAAEKTVGAFSGTAGVDISVCARWVTSTTGAGVAQLKFDIDMRGA